MTNPTVALFQAARAIQCPTCHAKAGERCKRTTDKRGPRGPVALAGAWMATHHPARTQSVGGKPTSNGRVGAGKPPTDRRLYGQPAPTRGSTGKPTWLIEPDTSTAGTRREREVHLHADETSDVKITLSDRALQTIISDIATAGDLVETGGVLLGLRPKAGELLITDAGTHGKRAERKPGSLKHDGAHDMAIAQQHAALGTGIEDLGTWHTHPGGTDQPSPADLQAWVGLLEVLSDLWPPLPRVDVLVTANRLPGTRSARDWEHPILHGWTLELGSLTAREPWYRCRRATIEIAG